MKEKRNTDKLVLKFPIVENIEYFDLVKNRENLLSFKRVDIDKLKKPSWREFQFIVQEKLEEKFGSKYPAGKYNYILQRVGENVIHRGVIKTISKKSFVDFKPAKEENKMNEIIELKEAIEKLKSNDKSTDMLLTTVKQGYELQISFLNQQIQFKENQIKQLENQCDKYENQLDKYESQIDELQSKTGFNQLIEIGQKMLFAKFGKGEEITNLSASNPNDIPNEIIEILGLVDYSKIPDPQMKQIISGLRNYISVLPLKGVTNAT